MPIDPVNHSEPQQSLAISPGPSRCRLLVWERSGAWAAGLRAALQSESQVVAKPIELRHQDEVEEILAASPASLLLIEFTAANLGERIAWLASVRRRWPEAVAIAVAERGLSPWQPVVREAGAEAWIESPTQLAGVARMARRQWRRYPPPLPDLRTAWRERLPW